MYMRSWYPIPTQMLDRKRLLAEHNELLIMARTIAGLSKGWANHPETNRWRGHSKAMKKRHDECAEEMVRRGFKHRSPWPEELINSNETEDYPVALVEPLEIMIQKLKEKQGLL
jgi:hypothetical protein